MTYYIVMIIDLSDYSVVYKSKPTRSKTKATNLFNKKANGDQEDMNPPNGWLPLLIPITIGGTE